MTSIQKSDYRDRCAPTHGPEREFFRYYDKVHILRLQLASSDEITGLPYSCHGPEELNPCFTHLLLA